MALHLLHGACRDWHWPLAYAWHGCFVTVSVVEQPSTRSGCEAHTLAALPHLAKEAGVVMERAMEAVVATSPNHGLEGSAQQLRCWVPVALRAPAPPQPER